MGNFFKVVLAIAAGLAISSLLISLTNRVGLYATAFYFFFILILYGWWAFFPFMALHYLVLRYTNQNSWLLSVGIGSVVAALLLVGLISTGRFLVFSGSRVLDVFGFGVGGGVYGFLYYHWITKQLHPKVL